MPELEAWVIRDIARRLKNAGFVTATAELQEEFLRQSGFEPEQIRREVVRTLKSDIAYQNARKQEDAQYRSELSQRVRQLQYDLRSETPRIIEQAAKTSFAQDAALAREAKQSIEWTGNMQRFTRAVTKQTQGELINFTRTTAFATPMGAVVPSRNAFTNTLDRDDHGRYPHQPDRAFRDAGECPECDYGRLA